MNSAPDEITVVIPTFNRVAMLRRALESVLQETRVPIKAHVFDNASDDGTQDYLKELAAENPRVIVTRNDENIGSTANYINAFASVKSSLFVPLADDDWLLPDFLFDGYMMLKAHPGAGAAIFFAKGVKEEEGRHRTYPDNRPDVPTGYISPASHMREFMCHGHYLWSSILWKKATLDHIGYPFFHTGPSSDVDYQIQVFSKFPVVVTTDLGAVYLSHPAQNGAVTGLEQIPAWCKLLARMDQSAAGLFEPEEYAKLRDEVIQRYRRNWRRAPKVALEQKKLLPLAALAGGRLNDFEAVSKLVDLIEVDDDRSTCSLYSALLHNVGENYKVQTVTESRARSLEQEIENLQRQLLAAEKGVGRPLKAMKRKLSKLNRARKERHSNPLG